MPWKSSRFDDKDAVARAAEIIRSGDIAGAHFGTVFGLIVDGANAVSPSGSWRPKVPAGVSNRSGSVSALKS